MTNHTYHQGRASGFFVPNAYTAYIIHAPVITTLAFGLNGLLWFALSIPIRKIPYADRVL